MIIYLFIKIKIMILQMFILGGYFKTKNRKKKTDLKLKILNVINNKERIYK
jgi:hypothetical protein